MAVFDDAFDKDADLRSGCSCGLHSTQSEHDGDASARAVSLTDLEGLSARVIETAIVKAVLGADPARRNFLRTVGASTALAALSQFFPLATAKEVFAASPGP